MKFYPYKKGGRAEKVLTMLKGGTNSFEVVLTWELEVLPLVMGCAKSFHPLKGWAQQVLPCLEDGGDVFFPFCSPPPLPIINDQSLISPNCLGLLYTRRSNPIPPTAGAIGVL